MTVTVCFQFAVKSTIQLVVSQLFLLALLRIVKANNNPVKGPRPKTGMSQTDLCRKQGARCYPLS